MGKDNLLMVADSERSADMRYALRTFLRETCSWFTHRGRSHLLVRDLDLERARAEVRHCRILPYSRYERRLLREKPDERIGSGEVLSSVLREHRIRKVTVPESFPIGLARALRDRGIRMKIRPGSFLPDRAWKTADEVKKISAAVVMAEVGLAEGLHALSRARPGRGRRLMVHHAPLTAERLRGIIDTAILQAGGRTNGTVVACGRQGGDPLEPGFGPLYADRPIIIAIGPRSQRTGYCGSVTRTVLRGRAPEFIRTMFAAVTEAHEAAMRKTRHAVGAAEVHQTADDVFRQHRFRTTRRNGHLAGFVLGVGHGIGLEPEETPYLTAGSPEMLRVGHVIALEPSLYYPEIGGVRLEDVIQVTRTAARNLTKFEKRLEI